MSETSDPSAKVNAARDELKSALAQSDQAKIAFSADALHEIMFTDYGLDLLEPREIAQNHAALGQMPADWLGETILFFVQALSQQNAKPQFLREILAAAIEILEQAEGRLAPTEQGTCDTLENAHNFRAKLDRDIAASAETFPKAHGLSVMQGALQDATDKDIAIVVSYAPKGEASPALRSILASLRQLPMDVHACIAVTWPFDECQFDTTLDATSVSLRQNGSYDFGSWAALLTAIPNIWRARSVTWINDSVIPLSARKYAEMIDRMRQSPELAIFLTDSYEAQYHGQSYCFSLKNKALRHWRLRNALAWVPLGLDRDDVIARYELKTMENICQIPDVTPHIVYSIKWLFNHLKGAEKVKYNPTHFLWERMIGKGVPFIKAELVSTNPLRLPIDHWPIVVREHGGEVDTVHAHLDFLAKTRPFRPRGDASLLNKTLSKVFSDDTMARLRNWNTARRHRRRAAAAKQSV